MKTIRRAVTGISPGRFMVGCFLLLVTLPPMHAAEADWPRFRGPNGAGIAAGAQPPTTWSDMQNVKWKTELPGPGTSSPILVGDRVFVTCWTGYGATKGKSALTRELVCVDRASGKVKWAKSVTGEAPVDQYEGYLPEHGYASHTPTSDGNAVFVYFGRGGAAAFDLDGQQLWHVKLGNSANQKNWGSAASPVLYKDTVIITASEEAHAIVALDKRTGKEVWRAPGSALEYVFGTPVLAGASAQPELIFSLPEELWALNPDTGKLRWFATSNLPGNIAPSVVAGDGVVFAFGGFPQLGAVAVRTGGKGDVTGTHQLWRTRDSTYVPTPVLHEGRLYVVTDQGFALCLDAKSGELVFKERLPGASATGRGGKPFYASAVLANGHFYAVSRRNGTFVIEAKPQFKLVAHNSLASDTTQFNATPAVSGKELFLRSDKFLYCLATQ
ncbi:MAG: pyrrolo-quinoline quinone [Limisphaerales bacterium]|nr:MAG: pyrrolo-quinoline quinone [Limisphaerales bacterium]KAG0508013.1 MAG: pyrrolo-quinoline quinone [Limisphaerales bacterium]TXT50452.1 MAG: pyrrolo-quinoline quinone [Limisphaerales bacterium]